MDEFPNYIRRALEAAGMKDTGDYRNFWMKERPKYCNACRDCFYSATNHTRCHPRYIKKREDLIKELKIYWDKLNSENKLEVLTSCLSADYLKNFKAEHSISISEVSGYTKQEKQDVLQFPLSKQRKHYFQSADLFLRLIGSKRSDKLSSDVVFNILDGASENTWLTGDCMEVKDLLASCRKLEQKLVAEKEDVAFMCLKIEHKLLQGYLEGQRSKQIEHKLLQGYLEGQGSKQKKGSKKNSRPDEFVDSDANNNEVEDKGRPDEFVDSDVNNNEGENKVAGDARSTQIDGAKVSEPLAQPHSVEEEHKQSAKDVSGSAATTTTLQQQTPNVKSKKQDWKMQASGPSFPSPGVLNSIESSNEAGGSSHPPSGEAACPQMDMMNQLNDIVRELEEQMKNVVEAEKNALHPDINDQVNGLMSDENFQVLLRGMVKEEVDYVANAVSCAIKEKVVSAISDCFQSGEGDIAVHQLEKQVSSRHNNTARQIHAQFEQMCEQAFQNAFWSSMRASLQSDFEESCKEMFMQVHQAFQRGMVEHTSASHKAFESQHSPSTSDLRAKISSISSVTQTCRQKLADGLVDLEEKEQLLRFLSKDSYDEAFNAVLEKEDINLILWLCGQPHLGKILYQRPIPLSPAVLLQLWEALSPFRNVDLSAYGNMNVLIKNLELYIKDMRAIAKEMERTGFRRSCPPT